MFTTLRTIRVPCLRSVLDGGPEVVGEGAQDAEGRRDVDVDDGVPLLVGHPLDDVVPRVAGIVDDDVDAAEALDRGVHDALAEVRRGDIAVAGHRPAAELLDERDGLLRGLVVEVIDHDARAVAGEAQRHLAPDAPTRSGDDGDLAVELPHAEPPWSVESARVPPQATR